MTNLDGQRDKALGSFRLAKIVVLLLTLAAGWDALQVNTAAAQGSETGALQTTSTGARFVAPKNWTVREDHGALKASAPGGDPVMTIVTVPGARDLTDALTGAAHIALGGPDPKIGFISENPADNGWDARRTATFESAAVDHRVASGLALRHGATWTVVVTSGSVAGAEKWAGDVRLLSDSLLAPGFVAETLAGRTPHRLGPAEIDALRTFLKTSMTELRIPGAAFALIDHGTVVAEEGLGVKDLRSSAPVTAQTLFLIASNTKGMTTLLLSKLVDKGVITWDEPVTAAYPSFRLGSAQTTGLVAFRHLVCACTGLPRKDLDWIFGTDRNTDPGATFKMLAATEPTSKFGEVFQYNNVMAAAAGFIAGRLFHPDMPLGPAYDLAMQENVFDPLGMTSTTFDYDRVLGLDHAWPHGLNRQGNPAPGAFAAVYPAIRPAGAAWSNVADMINYVRNELDLGRAPDGRVLFSEANLVMRRRHGVLVGKGEYYGMGLSTKDYGGVEVVHHSGGAPGFISNFSVVPDAGVGAVLLTNSDQGGGLIANFERRLIEVLYDAKPLAAAEVTAAAEKALAMVARDRAGSRLPPSAEAANRLAAHYTSPELGKIDVRRTGEDVFFDFGAVENRMAQITSPDGGISFVSADPASFHIPIIAGERNGRPTLTIRDGQHEYVYIGQ